MAKKVKITKGGQTVYPATVMDAVVHPDLRVDASKLIEEVNVSKIYPTGGIDGTNKYTLETAIAKVPASLRNVGIKCSFLDDAGQLETWEYLGGSWNASSFSQGGIMKFLESGESIQPIIRQGIIDSKLSWSINNDYSHLLIPNNECKVINSIIGGTHYAFLKSSSLTSVDFCDGYNNRYTVNNKNISIPDDCKYIYVSDYAKITSVIIDGVDLIEQIKNKYNYMQLIEDLTIRLQPFTGKLNFYNGLIDNSGKWNAGGSYHYIVIFLKKGDSVSVSGNASPKKHALLNSYFSKLAIQGETPDYLEDEVIHSGYPSGLEVPEDCYMYISTNDNEYPDIQVNGNDYFNNGILGVLSQDVKGLASDLQEFSNKINGKQLEVYDGLIANNGNWNTAPGYKFTILEVKAGDVLTVTGDSPLKKYALLKSMPAVPVTGGLKPDYLDGENIRTGYPADLSIPSDCFVYLCIGTGGAAYLPACAVNGLPYSRSLEERLVDLEKNQGSLAKKEECSVYLPAKIYLAEGITIELYNRQVAYCQNFHNFEFDWECSVAKIYDGKVSFTGTSSNAGGHELTLTVKDCNGNIVDTKTANVIIKPRGSNASFNTSSKKKILCLNDSYGTRAEWYVEMRRLFRELSNSDDNEVVEFVGTQKTANNDCHEGYNGYRMDQFCTQGYASNIDIVVQGVITPPADGAEKPRYSAQIYRPDGTLYGTNIYEVEVLENDLSKDTDGTYKGKIRLNVVSGTSFQAFLPDSGTLTKVNSETGDETLQYSSWDSASRNPFYINGKLDFNSYCKDNGVYPDIITLSMGTNGCFNMLNLEYPEGYVGTDYTPLYIKYFIDALRATEYDASVGIDWNTIPIVIGHKPHTGDFIRDREIRLRYYSIAVNTEKLLEGYDNIYFVPFNLEVDSEHDFTTGITEPVNPRQEAITMVVNNQDVHPQLPGYYQMSDGYVSCIYDVL